MVEDKDGREELDEPGETEESETEDTSAEVDADDSDVDIDDEVAQLFDDEDEEEGNEDDEEDSEDEKPVPLKRFQTKVRQVEEWKERALTAEGKAKTLEEQMENEPDDLQHYVDAGVENPVQRSQQDMVFVNAIVAAWNDSPALQREVTSALQRAEKGGNLVPKAPAQTTQKEEKQSDARVERLLKTEVRNQTEALLGGWSATAKKIALREVPNHVDLSKDVTKADILAALGKVKKEYELSKSDIYLEQEGKKKSKPPTSGKKGAVSKKQAAKSEDGKQAKERPKRMTEAQHDQHLNSRLQSILEQLGAEE